MIIHLPSWLLSLYHVIYFYLPCYICRYPDKYELFLTTHILFSNSATTFFVFFKLSFFLSCKFSSLNLIMLANTIFSIIYRLIYQPISFFTSLSLNTKSFVLSIILFLFFYFLVSFLLLSTYYFIFSYAFFNIAPTLSWTFFTLSASSVVFSTFSFLLISTLILSFLL